MAIPPPEYWPSGNRGTSDDPYLVAYMHTGAWLYEVPATRVTLFPSPQYLVGYRHFSPSDCIEVEVRFRSFVESPTLKRARGDNEAPLPELKPARQAARQSLREALEIVRAVLQKRAQQGHDDARQTLEDEIWWANSRLHCEPAATRPNIPNDKMPIDVPLRRVVLEDAIRTLERGARHLDLPPDFWRAMLQAVACLGLIMQHRRYEESLALALRT